ncbi:Uncharacterised protein [Pseudomonas fluorescens]|uniref:Hydrolase or metal-binding protein n=1 Tax=Pseudomonas fluorescens TaxID=294 RepID=A0A379ID23_PSEFL|nr:hypothetical protein [Pseudomonas fluorescens]SUD30709.1 Uncharacterised protein [Pseudomonas fluorescens]
MLKGLAITPPVLGRISIGKVVEKNGKRLPEKDDQFTLTSQVQSRDGWLLHPLNEELRNGQDGKLRSIPIRLLFNEPDLNFRADYSLFDRTTGRPLCVGNGETCKRLTKDGIQSLPCPSPDGCSLAQGNACKPYGRLNVVIGDDDPLGSFVFRTTGFNSIRTLAARLQYFSAISGNRLACLPLELGVWGATEQKVHLSPAISSQRHNPGPSSPSLLDSVLNYGDRVGSWVENPRGGCYEIPKTTADSWCDSAVIHRMGRERERPFNRANRRYARQG